MSLERIRELKREMMERIQNEGRGELITLAKEAMEKDDVPAIRWQQYTPSFNDGDPCVFRIYDLQYKPKDPESEGEGYDYEDGFNSIPWREKETYPNLREFEAVMNELEEVFRITFGDGVQVTIQRDGTVEVEDYDHD